MGPAYTSRQHRDGVPFSYIGEKLARPIETLRRHAQRHPEQRQGLLPTMHNLLVAYFGLHNVLAKANDRSLAGRLPTAPTIRVGRMPARLRQISEALQA